MHIYLEVSPIDYNRTYIFEVHRIWAVNEEKFIKVNS